MHSEQYDPSDPLPMNEARDLTPTREPTDLSAFKDMAKNDAVFDCPVPGCEKQFGRRPNRDRHHRSAHTSKRPWPCGVCTRAFKEKAKLVNHIVTDHGYHSRSGAYKLARNQFSFTSDAMK